MWKMEQRKLKSSMVKNGHWRVMRKYYNCFLFAYPQEFQKLLCFGPEGKNVENSAKMQERTKKVKMLIFICIVKKIRIRSRRVEKGPKWVNLVENAKNQKRSKKVKLRFSRIVIAISENPHLLQLRCVRPWWWKIVWYLIDGQSKAKTPWITDKRQSKSIWKTFFQFWIQNGQKWPCFWKTFCPFYALG